SAARSIRAKLEALIAPEKVSPEVLARFSLEKLRSAGLSPQKAAYLHDLAAKAADGTVRLKIIGRMADEEVIEELIQVKGIGRWTAQMFLIFSLGRPDVFPPDDLGIKMALRNLYGLAELPTKAEAHALAAPWSPHSTCASWYLWRSLDLAKAAKKVG
ncbi:MAG: DNA-3-methyladenine glycosylase 2 family protein, partial [Pirellulaceae bacterium]|nr:DNA-3-methyladenine glycosylase 2 family protein [Pirellulaceae bacterium]